MTRCILVSPQGRHGLFSHSSPPLLFMMQLHSLMFVFKLLIYSALYSRWSMTCGACRWNVRTWVDDEQTNRVHTWDSQHYELPCSDGNLNYGWQNNCWKKRLQPLFSTRCLHWLHFWKLCLVPSCDNNMMDRFEWTGTVRSTSDIWITKWFSCK